MRLNSAPGTTPTHQPAPAAPKKTKPKVKSKVEQAMEIQAALDMHLAGKSMRDIAAALDISTGTVWNRIQAGIAALVVPSAEEVRKAELARLDKALVEVDYLILTGDEKIKLAAINTLVKLQERRAKYLGLDAAVKVEGHVTTTQVDATDIELFQLVSEQRAKNEAEKQRLVEGS